MLFGEKNRDGEHEETLNYFYQSLLWWATYDIQGNIIMVDVHVHVCHVYKA